jgi:phage terminase large subunit
VELVGIFLYINECNNVTFEAYNELAIRTKRRIYLDFNPANEFWVHTELKDEPDTDFLILTYKDNEALDERIVKEIEKNRLKATTSSYWANWWRVYGEGLSRNVRRSYIYQLQNN